MTLKDVLRDKIFEFGSCETKTATYPQELQETLRIKSANYRALGFDTVVRGGLFLF